jgi:hypothetical protein
MIKTDENYVCKVCKEENGMEDINNVPGRIVHVKNKDWGLNFWYISIGEESSMSNNGRNSLVPCNESMMYPEGTKVLLSGKRSDCCGNMLMASPASYMILGCKFKIDKIVAVK